jgi:hypothetical protein
MVGAPRQFRYRSNVSRLEPASSPRRQLYAEVEALSEPRAKEAGAMPRNRTHHPAADFFECSVPMYGNSFRMSVWGLRPVGGH